MIPWRKYDPTDRSIPSHVPHLVNDKHQGVTIAVHAKSFIEGRHYEWGDSEGELVKDVTHWAFINPPKEETT
jgi:hypothetical protein